jgi:localization factor PodJL
MRAELPWNVAGIPPEAREAARAAARREGLSVGEWLTRRILHSFSGMEEELAPMAYENRAPAGATLDSWGLPPLAASRRDTEEMMARLGRNETESNEAWRRIEDQLRGLSRRLDSSERNHGESSRALSRTAQEMNIVAREQAQAFDQLGMTVMALSGRLERIERSAGQDGIREAIKALHQGLSRLADQITATANSSASQVGQLTANLEQLAGRVSQARIDSEEADRALEARINDATVALGSRLDAIGRSLDAQAAAVDPSFAAVDTRLSAAEKTAQFNTNALDHALEKIEASASLRAADQVENQKCAARHEETLHRLEDSIARLEMRLPDAEFERRLDGIERSVGGMTGQLEEFASADKLDASLKTISNRLDAMEKDYGDILTELRTRAPQSVEPPAASVEPPADSVETPAASVEPPAAQEPQPEPEPQGVELPPYEEPPAALEAAAEPAPVAEFAEDHSDAFVESATPHGFAFDIPPETSDPFAPQEFEDVFVDAPEPENFLAQARRSARAASEKAESEGRGRLGTFRWSSDAPADSEEKTGFRYFLPALVVLLVIVAAAAALVLSQRARHSEMVANPLIRPTKVTGPTNPLSSKPRTNAAPFVVAPLSGQHGDEKNFDTQRSAPDSQDNPRHAATAPNAAAPNATAPNATAHKLQDARIAPVNPVPQAAKPNAAKPSSAVPATDKVIQLANAGNPVALTILGLRDLDGTNGTAVNLKDAVKFLSQAAEKGQAVAQYRLGTLYERGQGVPADPVKAAHWYELSANQGNRKAMHNLAVSYASGTTGKKDMAESARWFAKAATLGLSDSQFNLAVLYERGDGVPQSLLDAYKWYSIAAAAGDSESKQRMAVLQTQLSDTDKAAANKSSATFHAAPLNRSANVPPEPADLGG